MIHFENVTFKYANSDRGLNHFNLTIQKGEVVCLTGLSGCGKTTVLRLINGLIPHFFPGNIEGDVSVNQTSILEMKVDVLNRMVGTVFQNPKTQFFCTNVMSELAFELENRGEDPTYIEARLNEHLSCFGLEHLRHRNVSELSGGEQQMIACLSVSIANHDIIVLDEPSAHLDILAIYKLSEMIQAWKKAGKTIVIAEHRLFYLTSVVDRFIHMKEGQISNIWCQEAFNQLTSETLEKEGLRAIHLSTLMPEARPKNLNTHLQFHNWCYQYQSSKSALHIPLLDVKKDSVTALIGHNGAGKSTFAQCLIGGRKLKSSATMQDNKRSYRQKNWKQKAYQVFQNPATQLFGSTTKEEIRFTKRDISEQALNALLDDVNLAHHLNTHPLALSGGEQQRLAILGAAICQKPILIFDEPSSGLDGKHMRKLATKLQSLSKEGHTVIVITHDYEFILSCADNVIELEHGKVKHQYALIKENISKLQSFFRI